MENSLYQVLQDDLRHGYSSYYGIKIDVNELFDNPSEEAGKCREFIEKHFDKGSKFQPLCFPWRREYKLSGKHTHTVSLYLLALLFEKQSGGIIQAPLSDLIYTYSKWGDYRYTWFLTCLYHDVASCIENEHSKAEKELAFYLGDYNIKYTPFNHVPLNGPKRLTRFSESLIHNYFRHQENGDAPERDHGIIGGYYLFDSLYKNFLVKTKGCEFTRDQPQTIGRLEWRLAHLDHFAYISDAIICHNLWTANIWNRRSPEYEKERKRSSEYQVAGLSPLIIEKKSQRVSFGEYPLQFMLYLLDSIEPVKWFGKTADKKAKEVLMHIGISCRLNDEKYLVTITWDEDAKAFIGFIEWIQKIKKLQYWMNLDFEEENDGIVLSFSK